MKRFGLTGAAGYVAPRHLKAIKETGNRLVAALDIAEAVGVLDAYFPEAEFFTQPEIFEQYLEDLRDANEGVDYLSICTPNYLHEPHIRMAFRQGADAICEKPLVTDYQRLERLREAEARSGRRVWTILQLRVHPVLLTLREQLLREGGTKDVVLTYITGRGRWYHNTWKTRSEQSGGLAANIGVHFFDLLGWLFGKVEHLEVHARSRQRVAGFLTLERARVRWLLSIALDDVPRERLAQGQRAYRTITVDGEPVEFSGGFTDLHTRVYERVLASQGFGIDDVAQAIWLVHQIREMPLTLPKAEVRHPLLAEA